MMERGGGGVERIDVRGWNALKWWRINCGVQ